MSKKTYVRRNTRWSFSQLVADCTAECGDTQVGEERALAMLQHMPGLGEAAWSGVVGGGGSRGRRGSIGWNVYDPDVHDEVDISTSPSLCPRSPLDLDLDHYTRARQWGQGMDVGEQLGTPWSSGYLPDHMSAEELSAYIYNGHQARYGKQEGG